MLPSAKNYLTKAGMAPRNAILILIGCFLLGALGISVLSGILHKYIPHSVVDCNDEHGDEEQGKAGDEDTHAHQAMQEHQHTLPQAELYAENPSYGTNSDNSNIAVG